MATAIRIVYALAIGVFVVLTVGFGTVTFFPDPERPEFDERPVPRPVAPPAATAGTAQPAETPVAVKPALEPQNEQYKQDYDRWRDKREAHRRRVLAGVTVAGALLIVAGLTAAAVLDVLRIGLMFGGLLTVLWGLAYGAAGSAGSGTMFVAALAVLAVLAALSHPALRQRFRGALRLGGPDDLLTG